MILNPFTVTAFFLAGLGIVLALVAAATGVRAAAARDPDRAADGSHLLAILVGVLLLVRGLAWPHFEVLLDSYVPALAPSGVMCAYGVTRIRPELVQAIFWAKPVALTLLGTWCALAFVERRSERPAFAGLLRVAVVPVALAVAVECGLEIAWLSADKLEQPVTCCTQAFDLTTERRAGADDPFALAGVAPPAWTFAGWIAVQLAAAALAAWSGRRRASPPGAASLLPAALLAAASLLLAHWAWLDFVAPRVLRLPHHHCVHEVVTRAPAMGLAALFLIAGNVALMAIAPLQLLRGRSPAAFDELTRRTDRGSALALASAVWIVAIHLF